MATAVANKIEAHVWRISAVVIVGSIMSILDTTIVNVALDTLARDLHSTIAEIQWVVTGYMLALGAVIPVTGWAARRQAGLPRLACAVRARLDAVRPRDLHDGARHLPRAPGLRRRNDPADRPDDATRRGPSAWDG